MSFNEKTLRDDTHPKYYSNYKLPESKISYGSFSKFSVAESKGNNAREKLPSTTTHFSSDWTISNENETTIPEITEWRRALTEDKPAIKQLQTLTGDIASVLYRKQNIDELIEKSYFPVVQLDSKGELISFTAYDSYPNIPSVPSFFWNDWLNTNYRIKGVSSRNVLFIHYMVWQPQHANRFLRFLLETSFTEFLHLKHIIIVKPPKASVPDFYSKYFIPVRPLGLEKLEFDSIQTLLVCLRSSIIHPLPIRTAFEKEFEIVMSVINNQLADMKDINKPYVMDFINFIYQQEKKTLICEFEGHMAGIMVLNLKIDLDLLNEGFELAPFHGLRKRNLADEERSEGEQYTIPNQSFIKINDQPNLLISSELLFSQMNWELMLSKIKKTESSLHIDESSGSFSSGSDFSEFSFVRLSSVLDAHKSDVETDQKFSFSQTCGRNDFPSKIGDVRVTIRTSVSTVPRFYYPKYHGHSNAFVIDFFAIDSNRIDEKLSSFDFLEAAFKIVPDREYCVLIIPTDFLPSPLLDLFVRVTPRPMSSFKSELYLCHKNSLSIVSMCARNTKKEDLVAVNNFLKSVDEDNSIYQDILNNCFDKSNKFKSYVLTVGDKIVGVSLVDFQTYVEHLQFCFDISDYTAIELHKTENQSIIKHLILNPIYHNHARFFIRDIMRLADVTCLYYFYSEYTKNDSSVLTALGEFAPVKPTKKAGLQILGLPGSDDNYEAPFSLYLMNAKLCGFTRLHRNIVIVVVGASRTALSFLENIIFGPTSPYVNYNNLICVTPHGLETEGSKMELKDLMFPIKDYFSKKYTAMLSLGTYVTFIYGVMTEINRLQKYIVVNNKAVVRYDYLILTCGLQYLSPTPKAKESPKSLCNKGFRSSLSRFLRFSESKKINLPKHLSNMFVINTNSDAKNALLSLQRLMNKIKNSEKKIIIYGHDLHAFLTIHTLLKLGIPGELIVFVEPFPCDTKTVTLFNDHCVDQAVIESIKNCKVTYFPEYFLYDWTISSDDFITTITFHSKRKQIVIPCLAFFPYSQKLVSSVTVNGNSFQIAFVTNGSPPLYFKIETLFKACRDAGLVFDGRLVINHNFKTNDNYIYAAGPFTKYARRYYANDQDHQYYNSTEVGQKVQLAKIIKSKINPSEENENEKDSNLVPRMKEPLLLYCQLPEDFNLFILRKPGKEIDLETAYNFSTYVNSINGDVLTTGDCQMKQGYGYFRLHLSPEGFVESITCYTKNAIDYMNLYSLYGMHERLLNNLLFRYDLALISDFYSYFQQPWAVALFHERFQLLRECNKNAFYQKSTKGEEENFYDVIVKELVQNKWQSLPESTKQRLEEEYQNSPIEDEIKNNLLQFLECFKEELSVYATSSTITSLLYEEPKPCLT